MAGQVQIKEKIFKIFNEALLFTSPPKQHIQDLIEILQSSAEIFTESLLTILSQFIKAFKKSQKADRGMHFIVALLKEFRQIVCHYESEFCSQVTKNIVFEIFSYLCEGVKTSDVVKREASAWMLEKIFVLNIQQLFDFPEELYQKAFEVLELMAKDKKNKIRNYAISIAAGLNLVDEVLEYGVFDPVVENRKNAVSVTSEVGNMREISDKIFDIEPDVRIAAYEKVNKWGFSSLSTEHRREVFFASFYDRNLKVQKLANEIIRQEINSKDLPSLLDSLEIQDLNPLKQKKLKKTLEYLLKDQDPKDLAALQDNLIKRLFEPNPSYSHCVLVASILKTLHFSDPNTTHIKLDPKYLISLIPSISANFPYFYCQTLITLSMHLDIGDEEIRHSLLSTLIQTCKNFPFSFKSKDLSWQYFKSFNKNAFAEDLKDLCIFASKCIKKLVDSHPYEYLRIMTEVVNEIQEPLIVEKDLELTFVENTQITVGLLQKQTGYKLKIADLEAELEELYTQKASLIEKNEYQEALRVHFEIQGKEKELESCATKIEVLDEDINKVLVRALVLTTDMLARTKYGSMHNDVQNMVNNLVQPGLDNSLPHIIELATECLAQCCLHNIDLFTEYNDLFNCILTDKASGLYIQKVVIVFYLDIMMIKDPKTLHKTLVNKEQKEKHSIIWNISHYCYAGNEYLRAYSIEGICKIFMSGKIKSSSLLAALMIPYFDSCSPDIIKQSLQIFFPNFVVLTEKNPVIVCKAFKTLIFFLFSLSISQDILEIKYLFSVKKIFHFICMSLSAEFIKRHGSFESSFNYSLEIFYHICQTIIKINSSESKNENSPQLRPEILIRLLPHINISRFSDKELFICRSMVKKINVDDTLIEHKILKKILDWIEKKNIGYIIVEDLESTLIDRFLKSENSANKFFSRFNSINPEYFSALSLIKTVFNLYTTLKRSPASRMCSELKRSKNI